MQPQPKQPTREEFLKSLFLLEPKDNYFSDKEAREKLVSGIQKGVDAIKVSYGPAGSNAILEEEVYPGHRVTNDGKTILHGMKLADPVENIGLNMVREVADKSDKESGDGRKTSVILTGAILAEGMKVEATPMEIKRSLDECLPIVLKEIDKQTKQITVDDVGAIAEVASESKFLGAMYQEIYQQIGKDGIVELDNSNLPETFYEITEGVRLLNCGFMYPYMANEDKGRKAVYKFPKILITKEKLSNIKVLDGILKGLYEKGIKELVILCEDIDLGVSQALAMLHAGMQPDGSPAASFKTLVIKAPALWKDWVYEDFSKITGATIVDPAQGRTLKGFNFTWLGTCDKIVTSKEETIVLGTKDISEHVALLTEIGTDDSKIRLSRLKTKTAILKLGANSETELSYIKGKALDARNASFLALQGGIVKGGGVSLREIGQKLPDSIGGNILRRSVSYPYQNICVNMEIGETNLYDIKKAEFYAVYDPAIVVKNSFINALSVASTILTTKFVITKPK